MAGLAGPATLDDSGVWVEPGVGHDFGNAFEGLGVGPRHEEGVAAPGDGLGDARDLIRRLALAEDNLREAAARKPVVVDPGVSEIFDVRVRVRAKESFGVGQRQASGTDVVEDGSQGRCVQALIVV